MFLQRWLESSKPLKKQIHFNKATTTNQSKKGSVSSFSSHNHGGGGEKRARIVPNNVLTATVYFRVKFFVEDPARLTEEYTRYHMFFQIRKDILEGITTNKLLDMSENIN